MNSLTAEYNFRTGKRGWRNSTLKLKKMKTLTAKEQQIETLKLAKKRSREEEIALHGKPTIFKTRIEKSKKKYVRAKKRDFLQEDY